MTAETDAQTSAIAIDDALNAFFEPIANFASGIIFYAEPFSGYNIEIILLWLVAAALFFTIYLGFINVRFFAHAIDILRGKYDKVSGDGEINRFQALTTSLSGTIGLGNIAGVAVAISVGGPGAVVWMMLMGFFSMTTKFVEVALGVKYRHRVKKGERETFSGGPMYYLRDAINNRNVPFLGSFLAAFFAIACVLGTLGAGPIFQTNQAYQQLVGVTGGESSFFADKAWLFGLCMVFLVGIVIIGGIKSIARVAERVVPIMGGVYLLAALVVVGIHYADVPAAIATIFKEAFAPEAGLGGLLGALLMGVRRAAFSNEAGFGTASIAHSSAQTDSHVQQGFVGMLGPFIDTVVVCTCTALVIVVTGAYTEGNGIEGVELTSRAFADGISWFPYILVLTVFLFAYSTMISWSYYGVKAFTYLFGETKLTDSMMKIIYLAFILVGASASLDSVVLFTDSMVFAMAIPNLIGMYVLSREIKFDVRKYVQDVGIKSKNES